MSASRQGVLAFRKREGGGGGEEEGGGKQEGRGEERREREREREVKWGRQRKKSDCPTDTLISLPGSHETQAVRL